MAKMGANLLQCEKFRNIWNFLRIHRHICAPNKCGGSGGLADLAVGWGGGWQNHVAALDFPRSFCVLLGPFVSFF